MKHSSFNAYQNAFTAKFFAGFFAAFYYFYCTVNNAMYRRVWLQPS